MAEEQKPLVEGIKHKVLDKVLTTVISAIILVPVGAAGMKIWENSESSEKKFGMIMSQLAAQNMKSQELEEELDELKDIVKSLHLDVDTSDR